MIADYNIPHHKVVSIVTDNASNITKAVSDSCFHNVGCYLHTMQLAINRAIYEQPGVVEIIKKCRAIVTLIHRSDVAKKEIKNICKDINITSRKLIHDVLTRWNSTLHMLASVFKSKKEIRIYLMKSDINSMDLNDTQWDKLERICDLLEPFDHITQV